MSEKDVKIKPKTPPKTAGAKNTPKVVVKSKETVANTVKDAKSVMKDTLVKKAIDSKLGTDNQERQPQKAETEATESVESAAYTSADAVYHKGKSYVQNKVRQHNANKVKTREQAENTPPETPPGETPKELPEANEPKTADNQPKTAENQPKTADNQPKTRESQGTHSEKAHTKKPDTQQPKVKTREEYLKSQSEQPHRTENNPQRVKVKTKENYLKEHSDEALPNGVKEQKKPSITVKTKESVISSSGDKTQPKTQIDARKEYVATKLKQKKDAEKAELENTSDNTVHNQQNARAEQSLQNSLKTRESYVEKTTDVQNQGVKSTSGNDINAPKTPDMLNEKTTVSPEQHKVRSQVKTKESYMAQLRQERVEPKTLKSSAPKQNTHSVTRNKVNTKHTVKTRETTVGTAKSSVKSGSVYSKNSMKKKSVKATKKAVKTQKEITKKAAKEAAKRAKQLAQKTAQVAKAAAKATAKIAVKIAQVVAQAVAKLVSALVAAGGWAVLIVVLIVIIIIAALAASPFGIFISEEVTEVGTIPLSQIIAECNVELTQEVENIELSVAHDDVEVIDNQANWNEIIAVFATKTAGVEDDTAEDVVVFDAAKAEKLKEVFRNANTVSYTTSPYTDAEGNSKTKLTITVTGKTKDELISHYSLTTKQQEAVETLLEHGDILTSSSHSLAITDANVNAVVDGLPDSLPQKRKDVVKNAASLVGKVNYFWGGKSSAIGWDSAWGTMRKVTAAGSPSSGSIRAFGLDCSGFVTWAFNNSGMGYAVGHGTSGQKGASTLVSASTVQAGDLAFVSDYSHVGIVVGQDTSGNILVIHCSSGSNNVVLATASSVGFNIFRRPNCY